jgi:hypothetical protein
MKKSTLVRKDIETLAFIHKRYREVLKVKIHARKFEESEKVYDLIIFECLFIIQ